MNEIQAKLAELQGKGWTLANIARELGQAGVTVESWNAGSRSPGNLQSVLASLSNLLKRKRIPKKKLYAKGSRSNNAMTFNTPLDERDTEYQTYGCRHTNPEICKKNHMPEVCAFVREDDMCKSPSKAWARQYRELRKGQEG